MKKKIILCILDGWGIGKKNNKNALHLANLKNFDRLKKTYGQIKLDASETQVGLPQGQFGNSEVGHMSIGAGRILLQDILRINTAFRNGEIRENKLIQSVKNKCSRIHLVGLLSGGGVHGHEDHLFQLIDIFRKEDNNIFIHGILDGRDSSPISGIESVRVLQEKIEKVSNVQISSLSGRFYAMDRDNRWERVEKAYNSIILGNQKKTDLLIKTIKESYNQHITDEFFMPINSLGYNGAKSGDGFFITNYRADRVRELLTAVFDKSFDEFKTDKKINFFSPLSMVEYSKRIKKTISPIMENINVKNSLGEIISNSKLKQLRIAETEKYAHVTYFFNGGLEDCFEGEDRVLVPSPRVETYDQKPEMAANEVTEELNKRINKNEYSLIVTNFANTDMVGHTGNLEATIKAAETLDSCLGKIYEECKKNNYILVVTSDHGNADNMFDSNKNLPCTTHSLNPVPFIICSREKDIRMSKGKLCDIAPTILKLLDIEIPREMDGEVLIK